MNEPVVGVAIAGEKALAGPIVVAVVYLENRKIPKLNTINPSQEVKEYISRKILENGIVTVGSVEANEIEEVNLWESSSIALERALREFSYMKPIGGVLVPRAKKIIGVDYPQTLVKSFYQYPQLIAASIVAEITRDKLMQQLSTYYPDYQFHINKGEKTKEHLKVLRALGPCRLHRFTFKAVQKCIKEVSDENFNNIV